MATTTRKSDSKAEAQIDFLRSRGAELLKREDRFGDTKSGWWIDDVYLGKKPADAIRVMNGC